MATLQQRVTELAQAIGTELKKTNTNVGTLTALQTTAKDSLVNSINEVKLKVDDLAVAQTGAIVIDDLTAAGNKVFSSIKTENLINEKITELLGSAPEEYNTLKEIADYIASDKTVGEGIVAKLANCLRLDEVMVLSEQQRTNVETTLNLGTVDTDFTAAFNAALSA